MDVSIKTVLILFYITSVSVFTAATENSYYGLCANPTCSEPVGFGIAVLRYAPGEHDRIKLYINQEFEIYVTEYGEKKNLYGVMVNGQKGYVPKYVVQENRRLAKQLVPAMVEFVSNNIPSLNQETSQIHVSVSRQEVVHHVSPDAYTHEQGYHSNFPSESYNYHSDAAWVDDIYASSHVHVLSSHVEATVTSQTSNVAQQPSSLESTASHIHSAPESSVPSAYTSGFQPGIQQKIAPQQQYFDPSYQSGYQQQSMYQKVAPQQQSTYQNVAPQQQSTYQNVAPQQQYLQSAYPSGNQPSQFTNKLQTSFSAQVQSNLPYDQSSYSAQMPASNVAGNEAQNYVGAPQVEGTYSSHVSGGHFSPDGSFSAQYSSQYVKDGKSHQHSSSYSSQNIKPHVDISDTIAALKAQGYNDNDIRIYLHGETANVNPSHVSHSRQMIDDTGYEYSSQPGFSNSATEINENYRHQQSSVPPQSLSSTEVKIDHPSSTEQIYSSTQFQQPSTTPSESTQHAKSNDFQDNEDGDSGEVSVDEAEIEMLNEDDLKKLSSSVTDKMSSSEYPVKKENVPSPFPHEDFSPPTQTAEPPLLYTSESDIASFTQSSETIIETKVSEELQKNTAYSDSPQSDIIKDMQEEFSEDIETDQFDITNDFEESLQPDATSSSSLLLNNTLQETVEIIDTLDISADTSVFGNTEDDDKNEIFFDYEEIIHPESVNETDTLIDKEQNSDLEKILNISELNEAEQIGYLNAYQIRNLKGEQENKDGQNHETLEDFAGNISSPEYDLYDYVDNTVIAIRSFIEGLLLWIPEPLYSIIMELENQGISPRVPVFTALSAIPCIFLIVALVYMKERSKEQKLIAQLAFAEKNVYTLSAEKSVLEEKLEKVEAELESSKTALTSERKFYDDLKTEVVNLNQELEKAHLELESRLDEIKALKEHEQEFVKLITDHEKTRLELVEEKNQLNSQLNCQDETICQLNDQLQEKDKELKSLQEGKQQYTKANEVYEEKLTQLQQNCNQLLKEAEIWNLRVNELNIKLNEETQAKQQLEESFEAKDSEIKSLTFLMESFKSFEELEDADGDEYNSKKEKLQCLLKSASISSNLQRQEEENKLVMQKLTEEKNKLLDMEVELLEAKSEIDKLKINYNQALQDKTEAQTKLEVLTNYFKDKEIQLQKQLGAQEVFREKREKDADSAERRIVLIEQENASYKYQVASMKQEMEETERNLKSQIAAQEKKAHENWIAARAAERKLEDMKQEVTQLRQKLTLLERDQGNFINTSRDDIIRPIPQRIAGINDETINSQDINNSLDEPPGLYRMPPPHMMLPDMPRDRPLPPLPLPPPPFEPPPMFAPPPFGPFPRDPMFNSEFRVTPPEFARGRASTPPRGRQSMINDNDMGPHQSSPLGSELRESRNSTPPHSLPDFHDIPPPPRSFYPPHRFPLRPPFRREFPPGPPRPDYQGENSQGRATQSSSVPPESWAPSNSRV